MAKHVWVGREGPDWLKGGTYLVARRIRMLLDVWDRATLDEQERAVGHRKTTGAPLGARNERDRVDLRAEGTEGPVVPADAHIRLAAPQTNGDVRLLRRSYSFSDGIDGDTDQPDAGLFFLSFQRDPQLQFAAIQRRLAGDALSRHLLHTGSAVFALPRGTGPGGYIGETLFST